MNKYTINATSILRGQFTKEFETLEQANDYLNTYDRKYVRVLSTNF